MFNLCLRKSDHHLQVWSVFLLSSVGSFFVGLLRTDAAGFRDFFWRGVASGQSPPHSPLQSSPSLPLSLSHSQPSLTLPRAGGPPTSRTSGFTFRWHKVKRAQVFLPTDVSRSRLIWCHFHMFLSCRSWDFSSATLILRTNSESCVTAVIPRLNAGWKQDASSFVSLWHTSGTFHGTRGAHRGYDSPHTQTHKNNNHNSPTGMHISSINRCLSMPYINFNIR